MSTTLQGLVVSVRLGEKRPYDGVDRFSIRKPPRVHDRLVPCAGLPPDSSTLDLLASVESPSAIRRRNGSALRETRQVRCLGEVFAPKRSFTLAELQLPARTLCSSCCVFECRELQGANARRSRPKSALIATHPRRFGH